MRCSALEGLADDFDLAFFFFQQGMQDARTFQPLDQVRPADHEKASGKRAAIRQTLSASQLQASVTQTSWAILAYTRC